MLCACAGKAVVFHAATAAVAVHNARSEAIMTAVNVDGTRHVIQACQQQRVPKLVYISSASVVWEGRDLLDVDETAPYALSYQDFYGKTKVRAAIPDIAVCGLQRWAGMLGPEQAYAMASTCSTLPASSHRLYPCHM